MYRTLLFIYTLATHNPPLCALSVRSVRVLRDRDADKIVAKDVGSTARAVTVQCVGFEGIARLERVRAMWRTWCCSRLNT